MLSARRVAVRVFELVGVFLSGMLLAIAGSAPWTITETWTIGEEWVVVAAVAAALVPAFSGIVLNAKWRWDQIVEELSLILIQVDFDRSDQVQAIVYTRANARTFIARTTLFNMAFPTLERICRAVQIDLENIIQPIDRRCKVDKNAMPKHDCRRDSDRDDCKIEDAVILRARTPYVSAARALYNARAESIVKTSTGIVGFCFRESSYVIDYFTSRDDLRCRSQDLYNMSKEKAEKQRSNMRSMLAVPIWRGHHRPVGVIFVRSQSSATFRFNQTTSIRSSQDRAVTTDCENTSDMVRSKKVRKYIEHYIDARLSRQKAMVAHQFDQFQSRNVTRNVLPLIEGLELLAYKIAR